MVNSKFVKQQPKILVLSTDHKTKLLTTKKTRVSHACSTCRQKKRKCDGSSPCTFCKKFSLACIYNDKKFSDTDLDEQNVGDQTLLLLNDKSDDPELINKPDFNYREIVEKIISKKILDKINNDNKIFEKRNEYLLNLIEKNLNSQTLSLNLNFYNEDNKIELPPRDIAIRLILKSWNYACVLFRFYHRPTIINILDSLYENDGFPKTIEEIQAQSLIYSVLAVGALFSIDDFNENDTINREFYNDEGSKFFNKARDLINFKEISDIYSIQTLFMMTIFLQCSANLKSCYYYIGIAKRIALREKLHRKSSLIGPTQIEDETKKRLFWSIYKVDIYLNCILNLPCNTSENNVDQELPLDVDDEKITATSHETNNVEDTDRMISSCGMNNEHTKLILILLRIYQDLYRLDLQILDVKPKQITYYEEELNVWYKNVPRQLRHYYNYKSKQERQYYLKPSKLLYLDFLLTKLILYKPFFQFICIDSTRSLVRDLKFQILMSHNCISVSKQIITLSMKMIDEDLIDGSYWFSIHTIFYSVACLTVYRNQLQNRKDKKKELDEAEKYYKLGGEILVKLKKNSMASERIFKVLTSIFNEFNDKMIELSYQVINKYDQRSELLIRPVVGISNSLKDENINDSRVRFIDRSNELNQQSHDNNNNNSDVNINYNDFMLDPQGSLEKLLEEFGN